MPPSKPLVILVRHAESQHNVDKDFQRLDPGLTATGTLAAATAGNQFPHPESVGVVLSSPSRRAVQTALAAFPHVLDERYFDATSDQGEGEGKGKGVKDGALLIVDADAQERSGLPCDTASDRETLQGLFPLIDFSHLLEGLEEGGWRSKTGFYSEEDDAVQNRAARLRRTLAKLVEERKGSDRPDVVVVTHGVFMKALAGDSTIDLPRPGWKEFLVEGPDGDGGVRLVAAESAG